jgi:hypothetical protein
VPRGGGRWAKDDLRGAGDLSSPVTGEWRRHDHPARVTMDHPGPRQCGTVSEARYEIRIRGRVGQAVLDTFDRLESDVEPVETVLHGPVRDQAELHGLLRRLQKLGLELIEVRRLPEHSGDVRA